MKNYKFNVWFSNGSYEPELVIVFATGRHQAKILAQAERIRDGIDYTVHRVAQLDT